MFILAAVVLLLAVTVVAAVFGKKKTTTYTQYEVAGAVDRQDSNTVKYVSYNGNNVLKYSRDGASALTPEGTVLWNGSYEMNNPQIDVCGAYAVIADVGSTRLYVYNGNDSGVKLDMVHTILQARVTNSGAVAVLMENGNSNLISMYNPYETGNKLVYEVPTNVATDGFPINIAVSPDGKMLATNYVNVSSGVASSRVTFYNFDEYGKNVVDHIVTAKEYGDELVAEIHYVSGSTAYVLTEHGFTVFSGSQIPKEKYTVRLEEEIVSVIPGPEKVGFVTLNPGSGDKYRLKVYNLSSENPAVDRTFSFDYDTVCESGGEFLFTAGASCMIMNAKGETIFSRNMDNQVNYLFGLGQNGRYLLITDSQLQTIKLTNG